MAPNIPTTLYAPAALAASGDTTLFTVSTDHVYELSMIKIVNNTSAKVTVKFGVGGTADTNLITPPVGVPKQGVVTLNKEVAGDILNGKTEGSEQSLWVNSTATGVTITVYGIDRYPDF